MPFNDIMVTLFKKMSSRNSHAGAVPLVAVCFLVLPSCIFCAFLVFFVHPSIFFHLSSSGSLGAGAYPGAEQGILQILVSNRYKQNIGPVLAISTPILIYEIWNVNLSDSASVV